MPTLWYDSHKNTICLFGLIRAHASILRAPWVKVGREILWQPSRRYYFWARRNWSYLDELQKKVLVCHNKFSARDISFVRMKDGSKRKISTIVPSTISFHEQTFVPWYGMSAINKIIEDKCRSQMDLKNYMEIYLEGVPTKFLPPG